MRIRIVINAIVSALCGSAIIHAQVAQPLDTGLQAYHDYDGGQIDKVNLDTGGLTITIPLVSYPQRGSSLTANFNYIVNSSATLQPLCFQLFGPGEVCTWSWDFPNSVMSPATQNLGSSPYILGSTFFYVTDSQEDQMVTDMQTATIYDDSPPVNYAETLVYPEPVWVDGSGASHPGWQTTTGQLSTDGSGYQTNTIWNSYTNTSQCEWLCTLPSFISPSYPRPQIFTHNGLTYISSSGAGYNQPSYRVDPDGNYIEISTTSNGAVVMTDTVGRSIPISLSVNTSPSAQDVLPCKGPLPVIAVGIWSPPGYSAPFTYCFVSAPYSYLYSNNGSISTASGNAGKLQSIVLPNGQAWIFEYNEQPLGGCPWPATNVGDLSRITFPTGGTIAYEYECISSGAQSYTSAVISRTVNANDGTGPHTWTYSYTPSFNPRSLLTKVTDPLNNDTVMAMTSSVGTNPITAQRVTQYYSGSSSSGTLLKTNTRAYQNGYATMSNYPLYPSSSIDSYPDGNSTTTTYAYCCIAPFTSNNLPPLAGGMGLGFYGAGMYSNNVIDQATFDYSGAKLNETGTTYLFQSNGNYVVPGLFNLISSRTAYDGSGAIKAQTNYGYDTTTRQTSGIAAIPNIPMVSPLFSVYGHLTSQTNVLSGSSGPTATTTYYDTGEVYQKFDPTGNPAATYQYSSTYLGALPTSVANAASQNTTMTYRSDTGQLQSMTDVNTQTTNYTTNLDTLNRLTKTAYPGGGETDIAYNDSGTSIGATVTTIANPSPNRQTQAIVDGLGRDQQAILLSDSPSPTYTYITYDALGRKYQVWNPSRCNPKTASSCPGETTFGYSIYQYDALSRPLTLQNPDGSKKQWCYGGVAMNGQTNCHALTTGAAGEWVDMADESGNDSQQVFDALGRLSYVAQPNGVTSGPSLLTAYTYDALGNLLSATQTGTNSVQVQRTFNYDGLSRLTTASNPETGMVCYGLFQNGSCSGGYDANSNLLYTTDARGVIKNYSYDVLNRLVGKSYTVPANAMPSVASTDPVTYLYDSTSGSSVSNSVGRLVSEFTGPSNSPTTKRSILAYDPMGRILGEQQCVTVAGCGSTAFSFQYTYDAAGDLTYANNGYTTTAIGWTYGYDGAGRLQTVSSSWNDSTHPSTLFGPPAPGTAQYGPAGLLTALLGVTTANPQGMLTQTRSYDNRLRITGESDVNSGSGGTLYNFGVTYTLNNNISAMNDSVNGNWGYGYDTLNRLVTAQATANSQTGYAPYGAAFLTWGYDSFGNYEGVTLSGATQFAMLQPSYTYTPNANSQINNRIDGHGYDAAGNQTSDPVLGQNAYSYDAEGRLAIATSTGYLYDAEGRRVAKGLRSGSTFTATNSYGLSLSGEQVTELNGQGNWLHSNVNAGGKLLATYDGVGLHFHFSDWLGSRRIQVSGTGQVEETCMSLPYGDMLNCSGVDATEQHFTGKERDAESGLDYFGARYYASNMGRFMSPDPLYIEMHRLADPQQLNLYMYGRNNPLSITDPTGLDITCGGTRCADYLSGLQKDIKGFKIGYDKNGKVETVGDVDKKGLSKSDKAFLGAIDDTKNHVTINAIGGAGDASTFFGASHGSTHTINFDQAALLDGPANAGGMTSASLVGHETLEGYDEAKGYSMMDGHNWAASLGFPGMSPMAGGSYSTQNGMVIGITGNFQIQGTNTVETIGTRFVTPIPQADFLKNARSDHPTASPAYPVSVEKKQ